MTLIVGVTTSCGIVLAADSRSIYTLPEGVTRVRSDFTHKLVQCERFGVASSGWASLSGRSVASHLVEFSQSPVSSATPELLCDELATFIASRIQAYVNVGIDPPPEDGASVMQLIVTGYNGDVGEVWKVLLPSKQKSQLNTTQSGGAIWQGDWEIADRIFTGICPSVRDAAEKDERMREAYETLRPAVSDAELVFEPLLWNTQDAVDFTVSLIRTTSDIQRFTNGSKRNPGKFPSVGGPIEIALVDPSGFRWIQETRLVGERPHGRDGA